MTLPAILVLSASAVWTAGAADFQGPFPGWLDVKRDFGAVGDGTTDDTPALQKAILALVDEKGRANALFLPAGTYRLTATLKLPRKQGREAIGLNIQGEDPDRTILRWEGPARGVMLEFNAWYSKLGRVTFDGRGTAESAITQFKDFVTANELSDLVFRDVAFGIRAGLKTVGIAETSVLRCRFQRCSEAGFSCEDWNSLDWWFRWCLFEDCKRGVTNVFGSGNFHCYECEFRRSTEADITMTNTGYLSFRHNHSIGSRAFFVAHPIGSAAQLTLQGNTVVDTTDPASIRVGNLGPVLLLDNTILSKKGLATGPVVFGGEAALISAGNTFTVDDPIRFRSGATAFGDRTVARPETIPTPPSLPGTPPRGSGKVFEVAAGSDGEAVQKAIDEASAGGGPHAVVHIPACVVPVRRTIQVPAGSDLQILGEGIPYVTRLEWAGEGPGPVLHLLGPSRAIVSDLVLVGENGKADGLLVDDCDQPGSQVFFDQAQVAGSSEVAWNVSGIENSRVLMADIGHSGAKIGVRTAGGPGLRAGRAVEGRVVILSGASSDNLISYEVVDEGRLLARDIWYESGSKHRFAQFVNAAAGDFTLHGSNVAHPRRKSEPGWLVDGFRGRVAMLGVAFTQVGGDEGVPALEVRPSPEAKVALLGCHGTGDYLSASSLDGGAVRLASTRMTAGGGGEPITDVNAKKADAGFLVDMLAHAREPHRLLGLPLPPGGATDARIHRLFVRSARNGITVQGR